MERTTLFTVGHSNHPLDRFVALLKQHRIDALVDIRRFPSSRRLPHFNRPSLAEALGKQSIRYHWLESLGGHRQDGLTDSPNLGLDDPAFRNYADYMLGDEFRAGLAQLLDLARTNRTAIMCAEGSFRDCHRRLVCDQLLTLGVGIRHVLPTGELIEHTLSAGAKVRDGQVTYPAPPALFD
jgi:uncharacterized protein (DUF488 family)